MKNTHIHKIHTKRSIFTLEFFRSECVQVSTASLDKTKNVLDPTMARTQNEQINTQPM